MKIVNFVEIKAKKYLNEDDKKYPQETDDSNLELLKKYQELSQFYNRWYSEHMVGEGDNGRFIDSL